MLSRSASRCDATLRGTQHYSLQLPTNVDFESNQVETLGTKPVVKGAKGKAKDVLRVDRRETEPALDLRLALAPNEKVWHRG